MNHPAYAVAVLGLAALTGCGTKPETKVEAKAPDPIAVKTTRAEERKLERSISVTGSLLPDESVTVGSEVAGKILTIRTDFGKTVRKGEVVATIDPTEYQIQLDRTRAALNQALARMGLKPGDENAPPTSTASLRLAQAQLDDMKFKYESAKKLVKTGDIAQERYNEIEKAYNARQASYDASADELRTQWMAVESLKADLRLSQKHLSDTQVRAPFDGSITQKNVSPGQYVAANAPILTVVKTSPLRLRVEVPESATWNVRIGTPLSFSTDAAPGVPFHAVVRELNPSLDSKNRTLTAEARMVESDARLRPGMFVQVRLITEAAARTVMVPKQALYSVAGLTKVFAIRDGKAREVRIAPGREDGGWVEVPADQIHPGDPVATSNVPLLIDGSQVTVTGN